MRRARGVAGLAVGIAALSLASVSSANAPIVDQVGPGPYTGVVDAFNASDHEAQTFVAGQTGRLVRIDMPVFLVDPAAGDLLVSITRLTEGGAPDPSQTLATQLVPQAGVPAGLPSPVLEVELNEAPQITSGTGYAIVLSSTQGSLACGNGQCPGQSYAIETSIPNDTYPGGGICGETTGTFTCSTSDILFKTYVHLSK
jgi:hypothetical protein